MEELSEIPVNFTFYGTANSNQMRFMELYSPGSSVHPYASLHDALNQEPWFNDIFIIREFKSLMSDLTRENANE
ncbi:hypothetical protein XCR1_1210008 [Xenorhabdus cabanillasii JM26]|uniref:Uncharacterized protein n=1 Tax=Xenorhabdus cabanillasii JM26 TaxID=1427517 RepID=W1IR41_9GAMM|nr:phosphogluconate dehydratase [Xenorhabdus cabanillasii JM26]CDL79700.1 hypothetical protein XCR1_1210008 [Xenorhabdus cabanillasii JM26]